MLPKLLVVSSIIFIIASVIVLLPKQKNSGATAGPIVFFGNSITAGEGANSGQDFPTLLGRTLNAPIVNAGVSGNRTGDALQRINNDVLSKNPSIVVIELGINDLLEHEDKETTKKNMELILSKVEPAGVKIVILGVKFVLFKETYETNWASLAKKHNAIYVPDILDGVIDDQNSKYDDIHPNAQGYQKIADRLTPIIAPLTIQNGNQ